MSGWSIIDEREAAPEPTPISVARAELLGVRAAPYGRRVLATVIDLVPAWLFCIPLFFVPGAIAAPEGPNVLLLIAGAAALLVLTLYGLLQLISHGRRGQTFGKQMMRLRTVRATTFRPIGFARALGRVNPAQCREQIEGGVAQGIGGALYEEVVVADGRVQNPAFRTYRVPQSADIPDVEVLFATTSDDLGPFGAKSMSESPYNPVAPAIGNAIARALGARPFEQPFTRERVWRLAQGARPVRRHAARPERPRVRSRLAA